MTSRDTNSRMPYLSILNIENMIIKSRRRQAQELRFPCVKGLTKEVAQELTAATIKSEEMSIKSHTRLIMEQLSSQNSARPFRTLGGYSCLAAHDRCKSGDFVVIIPGVGVPLIIRKTTTEGVQREHQYRLIDQAYVHGIMYGEFFMQNPRPKYRTLSLR